MGAEPTDTPAVASEPPPATKPIVAVPLEQARAARGENRIAMPRSRVASLRAFRRIRSDRLAGLVGVLLVVAGIVLAFTWPQPPVIDHRYGVTWPLTVVPMPDAAPNLVQGRDEPPLNFDIKASNVTAITLRVSWIDAVGDEEIEGDTINVSLKGPAVTNVSFTQELAGLRGNYTFTLIAASIPDIASVPAETEAEARQKIGDQSNRNGTGPWTVTLRLVKAAHDYKNPQFRDREPCVAPYCVPDPGQEVNVRFEYVTYGLALEAKF